MQVLSILFNTCILIKNIKIITYTISTSHIGINNTKLAIGEIVYFEYSFILDIEAKLGTMVDRRHKELTHEDIKKISETYHTWRGELKDKKYRDVPGFCKSASLEEMRKHEGILTPGRYVGIYQEDRIELAKKNKETLALLLTSLERHARRFWQSSALLLYTAFLLKSQHSESLPF